VVRLLLRPCCAWSHKVHHAPVRRVTKCAQVQEGSWHLQAELLAAAAAAAADCQQSQLCFTTYLWHLDLGLGCNHILRLCGHKGLLLQWHSCNKALLLDGCGTLALAL
jgi:hypothetical protein